LGVKSGEGGVRGKGEEGRGTWIVALHEGIGTVVDGEAHDRHVVRVQDPVNEPNTFPSEQRKWREGEQRKEEREGERAVSQGQESDGAVNDLEKQETVFGGKVVRGLREFWVIDRQEMVV
jgi:hypothetical protein